jgi:indole-3-glycerol phosphate synthase
VSAADREGITAAAIWVEHNFYAGDYSHLEAVRQACPELILIARDVVVDPWQIERCRAGGADAIELIPDLLGPALAAVAAGVHDFGLTPVALDTSLRVHVL